MWSTISKLLCINCLCMNVNCFGLKMGLMNLLDICCYNVKDVFGMIFDDLTIKCCYGCGKILANYYLWIESVMM